MFSNKVTRINTDQSNSILSLDTLNSGNHLTLPDKVHSQSYCNSTDLGAEVWMIPG